MVQDASGKRLTSSELRARIRRSTDELAAADPNNIPQVASKQLAALDGYYELAMIQAKDSFNWALRFAGLGTLFFLGSIALLLYKDSQNIAVVGTISGAIIQFISAINFYLYNKSSEQLQSFRIPLDKVNRSVLANSLCEHLDGELKNQSRSHIIKLLVAPANAEPDR